MAAPIKMDELLVSWLGSDTVYENVLSLIENYRKVQEHDQEHQQPEREDTIDTNSNHSSIQKDHNDDEYPHGTTNNSATAAPTSPRGVIIPPFYPLRTKSGKEFKRRRTPPRQSDTWDPMSPEDGEELLQVQLSHNNTTQQQQQQLDTAQNNEPEQVLCVRDQVQAIYQEHGQDPTTLSSESEEEDIVGGGATSTSSDNEKRYLTMDSFVRVTKEVCRLPSFFNAPLYQRILELWNASNNVDSDKEEDSTNPQQATVVTHSILQWYWNTEMEPYDAPERFYRLVKQPGTDSIVRDDFLPYIKALLNDHPVRRIMLL